ncbi:hypothetical protein PFLUV_G00203550 [Perca fluviatilis]|uniref:Uncharacterized protein n=1 Tax=Perca fluviatilis TaxID=8168 RepID=A0A6A5EHC3_PERFL|nr:hypothetical protein PFLUV_G00203550 [Perca fluviatilis]
MKVATAVWKKGYLKLREDFQPARRETHCIKLLFHCEDCRQRFHSTEICSFCCLLHVCIRTPETERLMYRPDTISTVCFQ